MRLISNLDVAMRVLSAEWDSLGRLSESLPGPARGMSSYLLLFRSERDYARQIAALWKDARMKLSGADASKTFDQFVSFINRSASEAVRWRNEFENLKGSGRPLQTAGDDTMPQPLEYHVGVYQGHAIAHCPELGQTAVVPLRDAAASMRRTGQLDSITHDDLAEMDSLSGTFVGDDFIEVGASKARRKIKKIAHGAKKLAKSKLGKVLLTTAALASGGAGATALALNRARKLAKKAMSHPVKKKAQALGKALGKKGKTGPKTAAKVAKKNGVQTRDVHDAAIAQHTQQAADRGDSDAQDTIATVDQVENATEAPLTDATFSPSSSDDSESDDGEADDTFSDDASDDASDDDEGDGGDQTDDDDDA